MFIYICLQFRIAQLFDSLSYRISDFFCASSFEVFPWRPSLEYVGQPYLKTPVCLCILLPDTAELLVPVTSLIGSWRQTFL